MHFRLALLSTSHGALVFTDASLFIRAFQAAVAEPGAEGAASAEASGVADMLNPGKVGAAPRPARENSAERAERR